MAGNSLTGDDYVDTSTYGRDFAAECLSDNTCSLFTGSYKSIAHGDLLQQRRNIGGRNHLQESIGGIVAQATDLAGGVIESQPLAGAEIPNQCFIETLFRRNAKVILIVFP